MINSLLQETAGDADTTPKPGSIRLKFLLPKQTTEKIYADDLHRQQKRDLTEMAITLIQSE